MTGIRTGRTIRVGEYQVDLEVVEECKWSNTVWSHHIRLQPTVVAAMMRRRG